MSPCDFCKNVMTELLSHCLQSPSRAPPTVLLPNPQSTTRPCHCWEQQHGNMSKRLTITDKTRSGDLKRYTLTQRMNDLTGSLLWGGSQLTCIVKTNSPCLSSHDEDVNTFQFQQQFLLLHRYYFIHDIFVRCKKSSDVPMTAKDNT